MITNYVKTGKTEIVQDSVVVYKKPQPRVVKVRRRLAQESGARADKSSTTGQRDSRVQVLEKLKDTNEMFLKG